MKTFTTARDFVKDSGFAHAREKSISALDLAAIDDPITDIVAGFAALPHCFTLQCCYGHFIFDPAQDPHSLEPVPPGFSGQVRYRIAYIGLCLENSSRGRTLRQALEQIAATDPDYIQFGSADWFWQKQVNSYALQVEPKAHMLQDEAVLDAAEARRTQQARENFFGELRELLSVELKGWP